MRSSSRDARARWRVGQRRSERSEGRVATRWVVRLVQGARRKGPAGQLGRPGLGRVEGGIIKAKAKGQRGHPGA